MRILTEEEFWSLYPRKPEQLTKQDKREMWLRRDEIKDEFKYREDFEYLDRGFDYA